MYMYVAIQQYQGHSIFLGLLFLRGYSQRILSLSNRFDWLVLGMLTLDGLFNPEVSTLPPQSIIRFQISKNNIHL